MVAFLLGTLITISSCYYEYPPETIPFDPEDVSYNTHVLPILAEKCATPLCHDGTKIPDLRAENAYRELSVGGYYNVTFPEESELYVVIDNGSMPPGGPLSETDKQLILAWIAKGALND